MSFKLSEIDSEKFSQVYLGKVGELELKGSNIKIFEKQLVSNAKIALEEAETRIIAQSGRLYIFCTPNSCGAVEYVLDHLSGITGWAKVRTAEKDIDSIRKAVYEEGILAKKNGALSFKIEARREDKTFALNSYEICSAAAGILFDEEILSVNVHNPDVVIRIEVRDRVYVYSSQKKTGRGLPVGVSGKGLLLLSGGIDSPVAGYKMMLRGMKVECIYFHSYPYTSDEAQKKVEDLAKIIAQYGCETHLNVVSFTDVQMKIKAKAPENYSTLMLRLCMMKCANMLAQRINANCLITGESLGQVASQTIENLTVTESFAEYPLLRPLIGMDKEEIVEVSRRIGAFETSILPYEDCCVLFSPRHPILRATVDEAKKIYEGLEVDDLIKKSFDERKILHYSLSEVVKEKFFTQN